MGDRYDISVDIGDGKDWWYVHGLATHDKVYGLNKQMCDLERRLSNDFLGMQVRIADKLAKDVVAGVRTPDWAKNMLAGIPEQLSRAEYEILEEILKEKNRFMEQKTKKMTKAEAFEYLKGKRVACDSNNEELVQRKLFEVGIRWRGGKADVTSVAPFLFINPNGITHCGSREWFDLHEYEEISADDILSIELIDENKTEEEKALDKISCLGAQMVDILLRMKGHHHVTITETTVALHDEGMCLFHHDPF